MQNLYEGGPDLDAIRDAQEQLQNKSRDELLQEFMKETLKQKQMGNLDNNKLLQIKSTMMPFLDSKQQEMLNDIFNKIM